MRLPYLWIVLLALIVGCNEPDTSWRERQRNNSPNDGATTMSNQDLTSTPDDGNSGKAGNTPSAKNKQASNNWQKLEMISFKDNKGQIIAQAPYPSGWNIKTSVRQGEPSITGPNGIKIMDQPANSYVYPYDQYSQQLYMQSGQMVRPWPGAERLIMDDFVPELRNQGWTFIKWYEVPEVTKIDQWYNDQLYKAVPMRNESIAIGSEWRNADGSMAFMITHAVVSNSETMQTWYHYSSVLKADKAYFEGARKQYIFSLANTRYALEPIAQYNRMEAEKAGQSWAAHNKRMAQNQANFEAQQRDYVNRTNGINEAIMSNWEQSNASSDRQHQQTIDGIREENNSYNPSTGQQYKTSIHYNNYWMNSSGEYISTNQNDYNPNLDDNVNNQNWQQLEQNP